MERRLSFSSSIKPLIDSLNNQKRVGFCSGSIRICDISTSVPSLEQVVLKANCADRFKLKIPYAGQSITWEVLLNHHFPGEPPDFIFGPDDLDFHIELEDIKNLCEWNFKNPSALINVVEELLVHYRTYQQTLILHSSRLQSEFSMLLEQGDIRPDDIEVYVKKMNGNKLGPANFLIKLPIDMSNISAFFTCDNPGKDMAVLLISFSSPEGGKITPQLFLSPRVEHAIGPVSELKIPYFQTGSHVVDYIPVLCELLKNKVDLISNSFDKKKEYIATFLSYYGRSVIEYDSETFSEISFLFEWNDFFFVIHIDVTSNFPAEQPTMTFQSVYHESHSKPYSREMKEYPYSPRWSASEMAKRARTYISGYISEFQKLSISGGSL